MAAPASAPVTVTIPRTSHVWARIRAVLESPAHGDTVKADTAAHRDALVGSGPARSFEPAPGSIPQPSCAGHLRLFRGSCLRSLLRTPLKLLLLGTGAISATAERACTLARQSTRWI